MVLFAAFGVLSLYTVKTLSDITQTLYEHPLRVSNAALSCRVSFAEMRHLMDVLTEKSETGAADAVVEIQRIKGEAFENLDIVKHQILGAEGKALERETRDVFLAWIRVLDSIILETQKGQKEKARELAMTQGRTLADDLSKRAQGLKDYAVAKAGYFIRQNEIFQHRMLAVSTIIFALSLCFAAFAAFFTMRWAGEWGRKVSESEARFLGAFEHANNGVALVAVDGHFIKVNSKFSEILEYSVAELEQFTVEQVSHPDDRHISRSFMVESISGRVAQAVFEKRYLTKSGRLVYGDVSIALVKDNKGQPLYFVSHMKDITEKNLALEALRKSEERYALSQRIGGIGTFEWNIREKTVYWADETRIIFGVDQVPFAGDYNEVKQRIHPEDYPLFRQALVDCLKGKNEFRMEMRIVKPDNALRHISALGDMARGKDGAAEKMTGVVMDITERKNDEARNHDLEKQLMRSQKMEAIGRLAGGVAHDFNNLLSIILGYAELLREDIPSDHPHHAVLGEILDASVRAKTITRQLLAFGKKQVLEIKIFDVNQVILDFEKLLRRMINEAVHLRLDLMRQPALIKADSSQLEQVLMNLVVNARDAMPDGGKLSIETSGVFLDEEYTVNRQGVVPGAYIMIAVSDTGTGIASEHLDRIYEPFFTTKETDKGSGMGLATVYGIVKQHGGNIWVYSEPGHGTTFKIYLPRVTETPELHQEIRETKMKTLDRKITVLVVEDDEALGLLTGRILEKCGFRVLYSSKPAEAIDKAMKHPGPVDLVVTDVIMPEMKGPEVYNKLKDIHRDIKVLYMSGYTENVITGHGVLKEGICFIQKPFTKHSLLESVEKALNS